MLGFFFKVKDSEYWNSQLFQVSKVMDEAELKDLIPPKQQNPLLKRKPLNLGTRFVRLSQPEVPVQIDSILTKPHLTLLLFAAEWCNISKSFLPLLKSFYEEVNLQDKKMEIVYVGFDKNKKELEVLNQGMPWLSLDFADERVSGLKQFYDIRSIPKLILLDSKGEEVLCDCRKDVYDMEPDLALQHWVQLKNEQEKKNYHSGQ